MWHNPFCLFEKYCNEPIICWTNNERCLTFNGVGNREHWKFLVNKYNSEETRKKISEASKKYKHTDEAKEKISKKLKGRLSPNKGKITSEETKQKISKSVKESFDRNNTREKLSKILKGIAGRKKGISYGPRPEHSQTMKNKVHMNNGKISKMIDKELIEEYKNNGWVLGRLIKNKKNNN